ncbi:MAG: hypothetical protein HQK65_14945 [Desulfamplus sp.]|nr:hypothetical protein [Desulfamplus sp.]
MNAVEFKTKIKDGMIIIPEKYRKSLRENIKVILLSENNENNENYQYDIIDELLNKPLKAKDFEPMSRKEIYER